MLRKFRASMSKNIKNLFRSWTTLSIILIGPFALLVALLFGFANTNFNAVDIGVVSGSQNGLEHEFISSMQDVANFQYYSTSNWQNCIQSVQRQELHLCLEIEGNQIRAYYDPARERVSLMLLSEIRSAVEKHKEDLLRTNTKSLLKSVGDTAYFIDQSDYFARQLQQDLDQAKKDLQVSLVDVQNAQVEIQNYITRLEQIRADLVRARTSLNAVSTLDIASARSSLDSLDLELKEMQIIAQNQQNWAAYNAISDARDEVWKTRNALIRAETEIRDGVTKVDEVILEIDNALLSLRSAKEKLAIAESKIKAALDTIEQRQEGIENLRDDMRSEKARLTGISGTNVDILVRPIELSVVQVHKSYHAIPTWTDEKNKGYPLTYKRFGSTESMVPTILALLVSFIAVILSNIVLLEEIHSKAFLRNTLIPKSRFTYITSILLTTVGVTFLEMLFFLFVSVIMFNLHMFSIGSVIALFMMIFIYSIIGLLVGFLIKNKTTSLLTCVFFLLVSILLGGVLFPVERMASYMPVFANFIPMTSGISIIQQEVFHLVPASTFAVEYIRLIILALISLTALIVVAALRKWRE